MTLLIAVADTAADREASWSALAVWRTPPAGTHVLCTCARPATPNS